MDILKRSFIVILFVVSLSSALNVFTLGTYPDFGVYYFGSKLFLNGENPYIRHIELFSNYVYPPLVLLFFTPFVLLPIAIAAKIWTSISLFSLFVSIALSFAILKKKPQLQSFLLVASLAMLSFPVKFTLGMGQINLVVLLLVLFSIYFFIAKYPRVSGVFLGISIMIKFFPLLFIPYFIYKKQWQLVSAIFVTILVLLMISVVFTGISLQHFFLFDVLPGVVSALQKDYYNQALSGFLARTFPHDLALQLKSILSICLIALSAYVIVKRKREDAIGDLSILVTLSLLINSFSWQHHFVWLLFPFFYTLTVSLQKNPLWIGTWIFSLLLVCLNLPDPSLVPIFLQSHVFFGALLLFLLQLVVVFKKE